ncbi:unnamed protein product [Oreochromis niloticus]|nr:unnamed protein product [Mustela putorius furo]
MCRVFTVLFITSLFQRTSPGEQWIFKHTGMNATLTFPVPTGNVSVWLKKLHNEKYIFYCRDGNPTRPSDQEESFKGRVEGMDCNRINGTVSVTLRNLTRNHNGTYNFQGVDHDGRVFNETVFLIVTDPVNPWLHVLWAGLVVCCVIGLIYTGRNRKREFFSCDPPCVKTDLGKDDGNDENSVFVPEKKNPRSLTMKSCTVV